MEQKPLVKISIEPHAEKKIYAFTPDGQENVTRELSREEKFARLVRQEFKEDKKKAESLPRFPWAHVVEQVAHARMEVENILALTEVLQENKQLSVYQIPKATASITATYNDLVLRYSSKQKELHTAASILSDGAEKLKKIVNTEKQYFDDLLAIRGKWLVSSKQKTAQKSKSTAPFAALIADYSYSSAGSKVKMEAELIRNQNGKVSLHFPTSNVKKYIFMRTLRQTYTESLSSIEPADAFECHQLLARAQRSLFLTELFQLIGSEALHSNFRDVYALENEIAIEADKNNTLTIQLNTKPTENEGVNVKNARDTVEIPFPVLEVVLHQILRYHHISNLLAISDKSHKSAGLLEHLVSYYKHYCLWTQINQLLHKICKQLPNTCVHWCNTNKANNSACELQHGRRFRMVVHVDRDQILCGNSISTAEELGNYILIKIIRYLIDEMYVDAQFFGKKAKKENSSLTVYHPNKTICITLGINEEYGIDATLSESWSSPGRRVQRTTFRWEQLPGKDIELKLRHLYTREDIPVMLKTLTPAKTSTFLSNFSLPVLNGITKIKFLDVNIFEDEKTSGTPQPRDEVGLKFEDGMDRARDNHMIEENSVSTKRNFENHLSKDTLKLFEDDSNVKLGFEEKVNVTSSPRETFEEDSLKASDDKKKKQPARKKRRR